MRICHPHQGFGKKGVVRRFRAEGCWQTNPMRLTYAVAIGYKDSGRNKPNQVILRVIYRLPRKLARVLINMNANDPLRIRSLRVLRCFLSLEEQTGESCRPKVPSSGRDACAKQRRQEARTRTRYRGAVPESKQFKHHVIDSKGDSLERRSKRSDISACGLGLAYAWRPFTYCCGLGLTTVRKKAATRFGVRQLAAALITRACSRPHSGSRHRSLYGQRAGRRKRQQAAALQTPAATE